jgi:hypothetical protein
MNTFYCANCRQYKDIKFINPKGSIHRTCCTACAEKLFTRRKRSKPGITTGTKAFKDFVNYIDKKC